MTQTHMVLTGSDRDLRNWLTETGIDRRRVLVVSDPAHLKGVRADLLEKVELPSYSLLPRETRVGIENAIMARPKK